MSIAVLNLGCPVFCDDTVLCVDLYPRSARVVKYEALEYLLWCKATGKTFAEVWSENLLEHLPDVMRFLKAVRDVLVVGGRILMVTDNAEFLPFYLPFDVPRFGIGAHAVESYAMRFNTVHYCIFSPMHLRALLRDAGFHDVRVHRDWFKLGARLIGEAVA